MANAYWGRSLVGGDGAMDAIDGASLGVGDSFKLVSEDEGVEETFQLKEDGATANNVNIISPVTNAGNKRWHKVGNIYYPSNHCVHDGVTDDYAALNAFFNALPDGAQVVFNKSHTYYLSSWIRTLKNSVTIEGNGATVICPLGFLNTRYDTAWYTTNISITCTRGSETFTLPAGCSVAVGQFVIIWRYAEPYKITGSSASQRYWYGWYGQVLSISGSTVKLSHPCLDETFTADRLYVLSWADNFKVRNFDLDMSGTTSSDAPTGVIIGGSNSKVEGINITKTNQYVSTGICVGGMDCEVSGCVIDKIIGTPRVSPVWRGGYGIAMAGHNNVARSNVVKSCKHNTTGSDRRFMSSNLSFIGNYIYRDPTILNTTYGTGEDALAYWSIMDMHSNVDFVTMERNYIYTGSVTGGRVGVFGIRNGKASIKNNHIVYYSGTADDSIVIDTESPLTHLDFEGNTIESSINLKLLHSCQDRSIVHIANNTIPSTVTWKGCAIKDEKLYSAAAPTSESYTWSVGEIVYNTTPGVLGWVCTVAGAPGTWEAIGSGGGDGSIGGSVGSTANAIPYASSSDTLADSGLSYDPSTKVVTPPAVANPYLWLNSLSGTDVYIGLNEGTPQYLEIRTSATPGLGVIGRFTITGSGAGIFSSSAGVIAKSADYTLGADDLREPYGYLVMMTGAHTLSLPSVVQGMMFILYSTDANTKTLTPNASDRIISNGTALSDGTSVTLSAEAGNFVVVFADSSDGWTTLGVKGTLS